MKMGKWPTFILPLQDEFQNFHHGFSQQKCTTKLKYCAFTTQSWRVCENICHVACEEVIYYSHNHWSALYGYIWVTFIWINKQHAEQGLIFLRTCREMNLLDALHYNGTW